MSELDADFEISTNNLEAEYEISEGQHFDCSFEIYASGTTWGSITGNIEDQTDLQDIFSDLQSNIDDVADDLSIETDNRQSADTDLQDNIDTVDDKIDTHIADKTNPHEVTKAQVGLGNVDNTSDLNKPISTATQTALNGKQNTINDLSEIRTNATNGQSAYNTIQNYGDVVTYNASDFATSAQGQLADTAIQPSDLASVATSGNYNDLINKPVIPTVNNSKITIQKNGVDVEDFTLNQSASETINITVPTTAGDINAVPTSRTINGKALTSNITLNSTDVGALSSTTTIYDLTSTAQQSALDSGANTTNIGQIATNTQDISDEAINRQNADYNLQQQIDAITSASDVTDVVGTYAQLQAYDTSALPNNSIIKVLQDESRDDETTYYRWVITGGVGSWILIGEEGPYYTKSQADSTFVPQTRTVNGKALNSNITLNASDVGALPSTTTIGAGVLTIQKNGSTIDSFGANDIGNTIVNVTVPTDTSDLTNGAGFITNSDLSNYATQTDLTNGLATKQDTISDLSTIRSNAANGQSAYTTIGGYGDIVTYNASNFVQKNGDSSTQTISLTSGTGTTALGIKSMATSSYISLSGSSGWLGSYGVSSSKRAVFYNGTGYTLAYTSEIPTNTSDLTNDSGYITGINSSDVTTALGYTPYNSTNPNGYTSNVGTVTSVNNTQPDSNGNVTLTIPTVNDGVLTITQNGTSKGTFSANQSTNDTIALTDTTYNNFTGADGTNAGSSGLVPAPSATDNDKYLKGDGTWASVSGGSSTDVQINSTSITNQGVANIVTNSAYDASSNKIATMSDLPASEIFIATYRTTTYNEVLTAYNAGKIIFVAYDNNKRIYCLNYFTGSASEIFSFSSYNSGRQYICSLSKNTGWSQSTITLEETSNKTTSLSSSSTDTQYPSAKSVIGLLKTIYPVGSVYLSTNSTCPLSSLFGTWTLVSSNRALWTGTGSNGNTTIAAGLPNIRGGVTQYKTTHTSGSSFSDGALAEIYNKTGGGYSSSSSKNVYDISFNAASSNSIYSDSVTTVQPPAYVVNVWRRTA